MFFVEFLGWSVLVYILINIFAVTECNPRKTKVHLYWYILSLSPRVMFMLAVICLFIRSCSFVGWQIVLWNCHHIRRQSCQKGIILNFINFNPFQLKYINIMYTLKIMYVAIQWWYFKQHTCTLRMASTINIPCMRIKYFQALIAITIDSHCSTAYCQDKSVEIFGYTWLKGSI